MSAAWLSVLRAILVYVFGMLTTSGVVSVADAGNLVTTIVNALPPIAAVAIAGWGAYKHTRPQLITTTAKLTGVAVVVNAYEKKKEQHYQDPGVVADSVISTTAIANAMRPK